MLAVPCGLPSYMGAWPPVSRDTAMIEPMAELAACTPHSSSAVAAEPVDAPVPDPGRRGAARLSVDEG